MFYQILRHLGMEMCDTIAGGRVEAISDKEWNLTWWMHYGCFFIDSYYCNLFRGSSWCFGALYGGWFPVIGCV